MAIARVILALLGLVALINAESIKFTHNLLARNSICYNEILTINMESK